MDVSSPARPLLSGYPRFAGADVDQLREVLSGLFAPLSLEPRPRNGPYRCLVNGLELRKSTVTYVHFGRECEVRSRTPIDFHTIQLTLSGYCTFVTGSDEVPAGVDRPVLVPSGERLRVHPSADNGSLCFIVEDRVLREMISAWTGVPDAPPIRFQAELDPADARTASVLTLFRAFVRELERASRMLEFPAALASFEHTLLTSMLFGLQHDRRELLDRPGLNAGLATVRRLEDYLEEHAGESFDLRTLVRATGHSARSIHRAFRRYRGTTPTAFLGEVRMQRVRNRLLRPERDTSVTHAALDSGFTHLGRFAVEYRRRFGETPRQTLRRACGGPRRMSGGQSRGSSV